MRSKCSEILFEMLKPAVWVSAWGANPLRNGDNSPHQPVHFSEHSCTVKGKKNDTRKDPASLAPSTPTAAALPEG